MAWRPPNLVAVGDKIVCVEHPEYGIGEVLTEVDGGGYGQRMTVYFEGKGNKTIMTSLNPVRRVTGPENA